ncbi:nucleoside recognition domain-containing protein [Halomonas sp. WWR20]
MPRYLTAVYALVIDTTRVYFTLLKVLIPAMLVVKGLEMIGAIAWLGAALSPLMSWLGLPDALGIVWATTLVTNMFTGLVVFYEVAGDLSLNVAQVSVLGTLMLVGHALPVEGAVARRAGVPWWATLVLRVGGALILGALLHYTYASIGLLQEPVELVWRPDPVPDTLEAWCLAQIQTLAMIFIFILGLMALLRMLRQLGLERWIHLGLSPLLRLLGIGKSAANVTVIGFTLGLSYGAGLLIRDVETGVMTKRDSILALCFLGLCHSIIEDTLLILLIGADLSGIFWARIAFAFSVIALLSRIRWPGGRLAIE